MVDLVKQLREVKDRDFHPDSLRTMVLWGADEIERLRAELAETTADLVATRIAMAVYVKAVTREDVARASEQKGERR